MALQTEQRCRSRTLSSQHRSTGLCLGGFDRFCFDTFVTELAPDGSLIFGTYLGGALDEYSGSIAVDQAGAIYMVGYTELTNFPVSQGSVQPDKSIAKDFFVAKISASGAGGGRSYLPTRSMAIGQPLSITEAQV